VGQITIGLRKTRRTAPLTQNVRQNFIGEAYLEPTAQEWTGLCFALAFGLYMLHRRRHQTPRLAKIWIPLDGAWPVYEKGLLLGFRSLVLAYVIMILLALLAGFVRRITGVNIYPLVAIVVSLTLFLPLYLWFREKQLGG
jgi:hypothetical protein